MADEKAKLLPIIFEKSWQSGEVPRDWKTENFLKPLLIWKKKKNRTRELQSRQLHCAWQNYSEDPYGNYGKVHGKQKGDW